MCLTMLGRELKRCSIFHSLAGFNELGVHNCALTGGLSLRKCSDMQNEEICLTINGLCIKEESIF